MLAIEYFALVHDLAAIDRVGEQVEQAASLEWDPTLVRSTGAVLDLGPDPLPVQLSDQLVGGCRGDVAPHDGAHPLGFLGDRYQLAFDHLVAKRHRPAHPQPLLLGGGDLVTDALAGDLALELGKAEQDVER